MRLTAALLLLAVLALPRPAVALVLLEEGRQLEGLWVFPLYTEPDRWVYLPTRARLAVNEEGDPRFSFTFFVDQEPGAASSDSIETVRTAEGGAIVHFLVTYDAPEEQIRAAEAALAEIHDGEAVKLAGPMVFESGRYVVVSSSLASGGVPQALQTGRAPVLAGNELALSFRLDPRDADILLATFRTDTPDLSVAFELDYSGLTQAYRAEMIVDWEKAQKSITASIGGNVYIVAAEAKTTIDRMRNDGAITLRVDGDDAAMEKLVEHVSNKALEMMFAPIEPTQIPPAAQSDIFQALGQALGAVSGSTSGSPMPFSISGAFELRDLRSEGSTILSFDKRAKIMTRSLVTANMGDLYARYGDDPQRFRVVGIGGDPVRRERLIFVGLDGRLVPEFGGFVDAMEVQIRKRHPDGTTTLRGLQITREDAELGAFYGPLVYGNAAAETLEDWRGYEYQTGWRLAGGIEYASDWRETEMAPLVVASPFRRSEVIVDGDPTTLIDEGVRAIRVGLGAEVFGQPVARSLLIRPDRDGALPQIVKMVEAGDAPPGYDVELLYVMADGSRRRVCERDTSGIVFVDLLPDHGTPSGCPGDTLAETPAEPPSDEPPRDP